MRALVAVCVGGWVARGTGMAWQVLGIVFPIFAVVLAGYAYGRRHAPDMTAINRLNLDIFTPALIFSVLAQKDFELVAYQDLALAGVIVVLGSGLLAWPLTWLLNYQARTFVPPMMFTNSGNMGLPLAVLAFGEQALPKLPMHRRIAGRER